MDAPGVTNRDRRITPTDYLYELYLHLRAQAPSLPLWDLTRRGDWFADAARVLSLVPHADQRMAWAFLLAEAFNTFSAPLNVVVNALLREADVVRGVRIESRVVR